LVNQNGPGEKVGRGVVREVTRDAFGWNERKRSSVERPCTPLFECTRRRITAAVTIYGDSYMYFVTSSVAVCPGWDTPQKGKGTHARG